jgi:acetyl-CoA carboxylase biotin carboxylase subunit
VETYHPPGGFGVRLDTHLYPGYELPIFYDSLIAKLICHALTREDTIAVMKRALDEFKIMPLKTTIPLYRKIMEDEQFRKGAFDTGYIHKFVPEEDEEDD